MDDSRGAIVAGAVVTAATTAILFVLPALVPLETVNAMTWELARDLGLGGTYFFTHPLRNLRFLGAIPGSLLAGYLSRDELDVGRPAWGVSLKNGILAGLGGLVALYVLYVGVQIVRTSVVGGMVPPPIYLITVVPLLVLLPFFPMFLIEAVGGALVGHAVYQQRRD